MPVNETGLVERFTALSEIDVQSAFRPFDQDELRLLGAYHELVDGVAGRPLFAEGIKFRIGGGAESEPTILQHAGEDALRSVMIDFRRLWMQKEPTRFGNVLKLLREHSEDEETTASLDALGRDFKDACRDELMGIRDPSDPENMRKIKPIFARQVIDDWMNGDSFHGDPDARDRVSRWSPPAYEFSLIKAVNRISNVCLALDVVILPILDSTPRWSPVTREVDPDSLKRE
jgi:hypothetical protein